MGIPRKIHRVWLGGPMPAEFEAYEDAWRALHPGWEVRTWREDDLGWLANAEAFADAPLLSSKANVARYEIVLREGGLYVDCDIEPLRALDPLLGDVDLVVSEERPGYYGNELFAAAPGHPVLAYAVAELPSSHFSQPLAISPERTGPDFWTRCVRRACAELGIQPTVLERDLVYPYAWSQGHLRDGPFPEAWAVHHWAKSWVTPEVTPADTGPGLARRVLGSLARRLKGLVVRLRRRWDQIEPVTHRAPLAHAPAHRATYVGQGRLLVHTAAGFPLVALADDTTVTPDLVLHGRHDPALSGLLAHELDEGDVAVFVGAGVGFHVIEAARRVGRTGRTFAYEADPESADLLERSVAMNRASGIEGEVNLVGAAVGRDGKRLALDQALSAVAEITLVRVDAHGAEAEVLESMAGLFETGRVRCVDVVLDDRAAGASWGRLVSVLRGLERDLGAATSTLDVDGQRVALDLDAALHGPALRHLVVDLPRAAGERDH